jgi:hypothetical protein
MKSKRSRVADRGGRQKAADDDDDDDDIYLRPAGVGEINCPEASRMVWGRAKLGNYIQKSTPQKAFLGNVVAKRTC